MCVGVYICFTKLILLDKILRKYPCEKNKKALSYHIWRLRIQYFVRFKVEPIYMDGVDSTLSYSLEGLLCASNIFSYDIWLWHWLSCPPVRSHQPPAMGPNLYPIFIWVLDLN